MLDCILLAELIALVWAHYFSYQSSLPPGDPVQCPENGMMSHIHSTHSGLFYATELAELELLGLVASKLCVCLAAPHQASLHSFCLPGIILNLCAFCIAASVDALPSSQNLQALNSPL